MRMRLAVIAIATALGCTGALAQTNAELKAMLDQAMKTIQTLQERVDALERHQAPPPAAAAAAAAASAPGSAWGAPVVAAGSKPEEGAKEADKARVEVYGQAMLDAIYDFKRMDPEWAATLRPSKFPISCPGSPGCGRDGAAIFSVRQSSLGFKAFIPTAMGELETDFAFDLFGADGGTHLHLMRAWGELGSFGAGQTDSLFMDIDAFPNTVDYWGPAGMVFLRNPQLRWTAVSGDGMALAFSLEAPGSAIDTGKVTQVDPALAATPWNRWPDLVAAWRKDGDWGHLKVAGIVRQVGYQTSTTAGGNPSGTRTGYGLNLAGAINTFGKDTFSWQLAAGRSIASYMDDGGVDLAPDSAIKAQAVPSLGWLAYYNHWWYSGWSTSLGYSEHRQDNAGGQLASAFRKGSYGSINLLAYPARNLTTGAEFVWGRNEQKDGLAATDYRLQFSTKVAF